MFGEGDMMRHLSQLTYRLLYSQDPLAEFDFSLVSMSADLKDGLRLCKLAEALTGKTEERKEKTAPFGINLMRSLVLYQAAHS